MSAIYILAKRSYDNYTSSSVSNEWFMNKNNSNVIKNESEYERQHIKLVLNDNIIKETMCHIFSLFGSKEYTENKYLLCEKHIN
jgi:hypothetical protein